jgi:hypothetical protein
MTFQPRNVDQHRLVRIHNALDALRDQRIYATDSDDFLRLQFSHPDQLTVTVSKPNSNENDYSFYGFPTRALSDTTIGKFRSGTAFPRQKHEIKVLRNQLTTWDYCLTYWLREHTVRPNLDQRTITNHWLFRRHAPSQSEKDILNRYSLKGIQRHIRQDLTLCYLLPMLAPELREYFVGKGWRCYRRTFVLKQKMKVTNELLCRYHVLRNQMRRRSILKVLDETRLPTDCGIMITKFLLLDDPQ